MFLLERIQFDLDTLLGDTAASDFKGIEFLNCFEYTLWQLMRQNGITDYKAALNTTAFVTDSRAVKKHIYGRVALENFKIVIKNLKRFYDVSPVFFDKPSINNLDIYYINKEGSCYDFIHSAIKSGKFVYALYNNFFDTINESGKARGRNVYHSTVITGLDDSRQQYIALIDGRYNIAYKDMERIYSHFERRLPWIRPWILFYFLSPQAKPIEKEKYQNEIFDDLNTAINDWYKESSIFEALTNKILETFPKTSVELDFEKSREIYGLRIFFYWMNLGCHGNLYLKLRSLAEVTGYNQEDFYNKFLKNRRKCETIANVFGRVYVDYSFDKLAKAVEKVKEVFIDEAAELRTEFSEIIKKLKGD